eukprot:CAMPEP_0119196822 /NCGR_PEP_ID=MMETSP1316-20130426/11675_1 /TAXON_ID=41880 /ORGANISM="Pycnococcus provasolii, Strain RCC2336" /LENGTH=116 /DNA_ID=CAMNT_0007192555 /DNA_START=65 /DNA_END=415 /DNA_ORIENTATION=+
MSSPVASTTTRTESATHGASNPSGAACVHAPQSSGAPPQWYSSPMRLYDPFGVTDTESASSSLRSILSSYPLCAIVALALAASTLLTTPVTRTDRLRSIRGSGSGGVLAALVCATS